MRMAIAGTGSHLEELSRELEAAGAEILRLAPPAAGAGRWPAALTAALVEFERLLDGPARGEITAVVLADSSDAALAAALVAAKIPLPLVAAGPPGATREEAAADNARVIAQLAESLVDADAAAVLAAVEAAVGRSRAAR